MPVTQKYIKALGLPSGFTISETKDRDPSGPWRNIAMTGIMVIKIAKNNLETSCIGNHVN